MRSNAASLAKMAFPETGRKSSGLPKFLPSQKERSANHSGTIIIITIIIITRAIIILFGSASPVPRTRANTPQQGMPKTSLIINNPATSEGC